VVTADSSGADPRLRVLVIDDDLALGKTLGLLLASEMDVVVEQDGPQALRRLQGGEGFDAVFCDLNMPQLSGPHLHAALSKSHPELARRIVFMTGGAYTAECQAFLAKTRNPTLEKPFTLEQLHAAVELIGR